MAESPPTKHHVVTRPRLLVGLGNPGLEYALTRHNVGFMLMDALAARWQLDFRKEKTWKADVAGRAGKWLLKPLTYMNESGRAVAAAMRYHRLQPADILVVYDDIDLALGSFKLRGMGSAAGHNGVKSLIDHLGTNEFPRLKLGIAPASGRPTGERLAEFVLARFSKDEQILVAQMLDRALDAVTHVFEQGLESAMAVFHRRATPPSTPAQSSPHQPEKSSPS